MKRTLSLLLCTILALSPVISIASQNSFLDDYDAIENASNSVLYIETDVDYDSEHYTSGSGFVAFDSKTFVTNYHVIEDAVSIKVYDEDYKEYAVGEILVVDKERDIAIISFKSAIPLKPLTLAITPDLKRGQPIATIGYPQGMFCTLSTGIISAIIDFDNRREIQFTAPISHGNSGGALFNNAGEVIGITSSMLIDSQNVNYAIDISHAISLYTIAGKYPLSPTPTVKPTNTPAMTPSSQAEANYVHLSLYDEGKDVLNLQKRLQALGYYPDIITRVYEKSTFDAVRQFQRANGLTQTGVADVKTQEVLFSMTAVSADKYFGAGITFSPQPQVTKKPTATVIIYVPKATPIASPLPTPAPTPSPTPAPISYVSQEETAKYNPQTIGASGPDVARLKKRLYELGYSSSKSGNNTFTEITADLIKEFQRVNGLPVDGVASPILQALMFSDYANPKPTPTPKPSPTPKPTPRLSKPTNVKTKVSGTTVTITWSAVKGADYYDIFRSTSLSGSLYFIGTISTNKYTDYQTERGETYYYKVTSVNGQNASELSSYAKAVMPKPTPPPYVEPEYPLEDTGITEYGTSNGEKWFRSRYKNISKESTVDGFTIVYYAEDLYGERLSQLVEKTIILTIRPGETKTAQKITLTWYSYRVIKRIYTAISRIHFSDGRTVEVPEYSREYWYMEY